MYVELTYLSQNEPNWFNILFNTHQLVLRQLIILYSFLIIINDIIIHIFTFITIVI